MRKINWFEYSGVMGGQHGMEVDFKFEKIEYHNGKTSDIEGKENDVLWVINKNIEYIHEKISKLSKRVGLQKTFRRTIPGGFAETSPLSEDGKKRYIEKIKKLTEDLEFYNEKREEYSS